MNRISKRSKLPLCACGCRQPENWQKQPDKSWDYNVATVGEQPLADAMIAMKAGTPQDIAESWMQLIVNMNRKD